ncbi:MAG: hypothetical protein LLG00_03160 [Planctomycetaceae bacterium]|nr:hypothetical protein [Planctomycetaceae bacterium]
MATSARTDNSSSLPIEQRAEAAGRHVVLFLAGLSAGWLAAGSTGMLGHPLQRALTWLALGAAVVAAWPDKGRSLGASLVLVVGVVTAILFTASSVPAANVLAVAVLLAAIAQTSRGLSGRLALIVALAISALAVFRLACVSVPAVWHAADTVGWLLGRVAGLLTGDSLTIGATFAGLDFLVPITVVYFAWLKCTATPRRSRALRAAAAIIVGHCIYLAALAYSEYLLAWLPKPAVARLSDINHVGVWTWHNGLRTLIPWNVPICALLIHGVTLGVMVGTVRWLPLAETTESEKWRKDKDISGAKLLLDMMFGLGPSALAVVFAAMLLAAWAAPFNDLRGTTIVAYQGNVADWVRPRYDSETDGQYGMLPLLVKSLGGELILSKDLSEQDLAKAHALLLLGHEQPWKKETLGRVWNYARNGGSVLVAATSGRFANDALEPVAIRINAGTATPRASHWEQSYDALAHLATIRWDNQRDPVGFRQSTSLSVGWAASPMLVGRWGWNGTDAPPLKPTEVRHAERDEHIDAHRFGDLVLAAEHRCGAGRVVVLGDASPFANDALPGSYPFVGQLLRYLADHSPSPNAAPRQAFMLASLAAILTLLCFRPVAWQVMLTSSVLAASLVYFTTVAYWSARVLPNSRAEGAAAVAYIDASHLESYEGGPANRQYARGIAGLLRTLMRHGYLPLLASDLSHERLQSAKLLFTVGPMRPFSAAEHAVIRQFVEADGGTLIAMVGAEEARGSASLLADFGFKVPPSPVPPSEDAREPEPLGAKVSRFIDEGDQQYQFYAAWPVEYGSDANVWSAWSAENESRAVIASRRVNNGSVVVIADTHLASNENFGTGQSPDRDVIQFWRWLLTRVVPGEKAWNPGPGTDDVGGKRPASKEAEDALDTTDEASDRDQEPPDESEL